MFTQPCRQILRSRELACQMPPDLLPWHVPFVPLSIARAISAISSSSCSCSSSRISWAATQMLWRMQQAPTTFGANTGRISRALRMIFMSMVVAAIRMCLAQRLVGWAVLNSAQWLVSWALTRCCKLFALSIQTAEGAAASSVETQLWTSEQLVWEICSTFL